MKNAEQRRRGGIRRRDFLVRAAGRAAALATAGGLLRPRAGKTAGRERLRRLPYYSSRSDLDAGVACLRMILNFYEPDKHFLYRDAAEMIFHREGFWIFEAQCLPILMKKGYRAGLHAATPYRELAAGQKPSRYGPSAPQRIDEKALAWASRYLSEKNFLGEAVAFDRVLEWLERGEILLLSVHPGILRQTPALPYSRYQIILTGRENNFLFYHDPSLGPFRRSHRELLRQAFEASPADRAVLRVTS